MTYTAKQASDILANNPSKNVIEIIQLVKDVSGAWLALPLTVHTFYLVA